MNQSDLETNREIRRVLVRHWIDLGKLSFRSSSGKVWIRGSLVRIAGSPETLTPAIVDDVFSELRRVRGITQLSTELENWIMVLGKWQPLNRRPKQASAFSFEPPPDAPATLEISEPPDDGPP